MISHADASLVLERLALLISMDKPSEYLAEGDFEKFRAVASYQRGLIDATTVVLEFSESEPQIDSHPE